LKRKEKLVPLLRTVIEMGNHYYQNKSYQGESRSTSHSYHRRKRIH